MDRTSNPRRVAVTFSLLLAAAMGLWASPTAAQNTGDRFRILVPFFLNTVDADDDKFGKKVAEEVRKVFENMPRHRAVEKDEMKKPLSDLGLKEEALTDCNLAGQFANRTGIELVMCGSYVGHPNDDGARVKAQIIAADRSFTFEMPEFDAPSPKDAAARIATEFATFEEQLRQAAFCDEAMRNEQWDQALENCNQALAINDKHFGSVYNRASALWKLDRREEALQGFQRALELKPTDDNALKAAALLSTALGRQADAEKYFHEFLILNPGDMQVRVTLAVEAANAGNPEVGLRLIEEGMNPDSVDPTALEYAGQMAMNAARAKLQEGPANGAADAARPFFEKALGYFEPLFELKGSEIDPGILSNMLVAYTQLDQPEKALAFGARAVEAAPDHASLLSAYADALNKADRTDEAIAMLERAARADPSIKPNGRRAQWELARGNIQAGIEALNAAIAANELAPDQVDGLTQTLSASIYNTVAKAKRYDEALALYARARRLSDAPVTQGMLDFFEALALFEPADAAMRNPTITAAQARALLPKLQKAKQLMSTANRWATSGTNAENRQKVLSAIDEWILFAEALIKRGGGI